MEKEKLENEIQRIEEFTCSYYYPLFEEAKKNTMATPLMAEVVWNTIKNRSAYVFKLREKLQSLPQSSKGI